MKEIAALVTLSSGNGEVAGTAQSGSSGKWRLGGLPPSEPSNLNGPNDCEEGSKL